MNDILIGIDAGTSVIKAVAFNLKGEQLAVSARRNSYVSVESGGVEQEMERTWTDTAETLKDVVAQLDSGRVAAIAVTGQGEGTWLVDSIGKPVAPALLWLDARAAEIVESLEQAPEARRRFEITGTGLAACQQGPQLAWLKQHDPERLKQADTAFHCKDWLYYRLTGKLATDPSEGIFTFGDFRKKAYSFEVLEILGLGDCQELLPEIVEGTQHADGLLGEVANSCGLPSGTPVVLGYVDVICTALGAGLYDPQVSTGCTIIGSTGMHMRLASCVEEVGLNEESTGYTIVFPVEGAYAQMQSNLAGTLNIDWMLDLALDVLASQGVSRKRLDLLEGLDERILGAPPAEMLFHPYISRGGERGPFIDADARASFIGLNTTHGYFDLIRGVYEGLALAARDCYESAGGVPQEVRLSGGAAKSKALRSIFGSVLKTRIRTSARGEAGATGAAMMAAVSIGLYADMNTCASSWAKPYLGVVEDFDESVAQIYDSVYATYVEARKAFKPVWKSLKAVRETSGH